MTRKLITQSARFIAPIIRTLLMLFFHRKHLTGRHFEIGLSGYAWAFRAAWSRNVLRLGRTYPWPVALGVSISNPNNIVFHPDDLNNFQSPGAYFQNFSGRIVIGKGSYIAPNVGLITANHRLDNLDRHEEGQDILIGEGCWIGMNSVVLPGVVLGAHTVVAAGAVVNSSFPEGKVLVGGIPARILKRLHY